MILDFLNLLSIVFYPKKISRVLIRKQLFLNVLQVFDGVRLRLITLIMTWKNLNVNLKSFFVSLGA